MKKNFTLGIILILCLSLLVGCGQKNKEDLKDESPDPIELEETSKDDNLENTMELRIASMKGPTTIGMARVMDKFKDGEELKLNNEATKLNFDFNVVSMPEEIVTGLTKGDVDLATLPANLAASLYNKTEGELLVLSTNTMGLLYIVENGDQIKEVEDLNGKTIYSIGMGTTPEGVLNDFMINNEVLADIEYRSEASEIGALLNSQENIIAMLPEPFVSGLELKNEDIKRVFDMNEEWKKNNNGNTMVTGVLVARREFVEENSELIDWFLKEYEESINYALENPKEIGPIVESYGIIPEGLAEKSIPNCNLKFLKGQEMKEVLSTYLEDLFNFKKELIGGNLPGEDFYY